MSRADHDHGKRIGRQIPVWPKLVSCIGIVVATAMAASAFVPLDTLKPLGGLIRRRDDVTPQRYVRLQQVGVVLGASLAATAVLLWRRGSEADSIARRLGTEVRNVRISRPTLPVMLVLTVIVGAGAAFRIRYLDVPVAYDEAYSLLSFARRPWYIALADYNVANNHLLNTFLMHWCYRIWGQQDWAMRLPALTAGVLVLATAYPWAKPTIGPAGALIAATLLACAPTLIDYSVNARGYMFVILFALIMDLCFQRIASTGRSAAAWAASWLALVLGVWAVPVMLIPASGIVAGYLLFSSSPGSDQDGDSTLVDRLRQILVFGWLALVAVAFLFAPGYVFRGLAASNNTLLEPTTWSDWLSRFPPCAYAAVARWAASMGPAEVWTALFVTGLFVLTPRRNAGRLVCVFAPFLLLAAMGRLTPPPRIWLVLAPWFFLGVGAACGRLVNAALSKRSFEAASLVSLIGIAWGFFFVIRTPVVIDPEQRTPEIVSVPEAVNIIAAGGDSPSRALAPLPCDLPTLYYLVKHDSPFPVNGAPKEDETLWLLTPVGLSPEQTLSDGVIGWSQNQIDARRWEPVQTLPYLRVWRSEEERLKAEGEMKKE